MVVVAVDREDDIGRSMEKLRENILESLKIEASLQWLTRHLPSWVDKLPVLRPPFNSFIFWIYLTLAANLVLMLALKAFS